MPRGKTSSGIAKTRPTALAYRPITPDYVAALMSYAEILYKAGMTPTGKGAIARPETVAAIIEVGRDVGLPATQALAWIMLVNGKPSIWGDAAMALIRSSGLLADGYPREKFEGTHGEDDFTAVFAIKRSDGSEERVSRFSIADAKLAGLWGKAGPWTTYPTRQLMWRAKGFACRDEFQDVLCGLVFAEEALDYPNITVTAQVVQQESGPSPDATTTNAPAATTTANAPAATQEPPTESSLLTPITDEQKERLADLFSFVYGARSLNNDADRRAARLEYLEPFGVESGLDLTTDQAAKLIDQLAKQHDPFERPQSQPPPPKEQAA